MATAATTVAMASVALSTNSPMSPAKSLISRIASETNVNYMAYEPCITYLNGEYWGIYGIREKIDEHYVESNHGISSDKVDLLNI